MRIHRAISICCLLLVFITPALAWPPGTHAYIAGRLKPGTDPANLMFGAMSPDINQVLSTDQLSPFFFATHYPAMPGLTDQGFLDFWNTAQVSNTPAARSLAFGFATHNEAWGADYFAHIRSHLYHRYANPQYPNQDGYVWVKAGQLCPLMKGQLSRAGIDDPMLNFLLSDTMNCHFIVEYGMDLLLKATRDPLIGAKVLSAAQAHDSATLQALFVGTYTQSVNVAYPMSMGMAMAGGEPAWSAVLEQYGTALSLPMKQAVPAVATFLEALAERQLGPQLGLQPGETLPPDKKQQLTTVIELGLVDSLGLCTYDFGLELDLTVLSVRFNLAAHGVKY